jgi:hypothetical protein
MELLMLRSSLVSLKKVKLKQYDTIIDVSGKLIYPSFIATASPGDDAVSHWPRLSV